MNPPPPPIVSSSKDPVAADRGGGNGGGNGGGLPLEVLAYEGAKSFRVGTLTYTAAGLVWLFFWLLLGDFALAMRERSVTALATSLLTQFKASNTVIAILIQVLPQAVGFLLIPILSVKSDRHRSRWGRRIPFLLIPTPVAALSMVGLAFCPQMGKALAPVVGLSENHGVVLTFSVFWTLFEVAAITGVALLGALVNDVVPREFLGRFFGLFRMVSLAAGAIFNFWLFKWATTHFTEIFLGVGVIFGVGFTVMCMMVKEGDYPPPVENPDDPRTRGFVNNVRIYFQECFSKPYYLLVFSAMLVAALTFVPFNLFSLPYSKSLKLDDQYYGTLIAGSYLISICLAFPLGWMVDKFHPLRVGLVALVLYALAVLYGALFVKDGPTFGVAMVSHTVLSGTYFTATASLGQFLFPKLKFAQFASAAGLIGAMGNMAIGLVLGPLLDFSGSNYRLTFVIGLGLCATTIVLMLMVYARFMKLGGPKGYVAPE